MGFRHISTDIKERALWLLDNDYISEEVAELLGVSERSIARWESNQEQHGSVVPPRNYLQGRPRTLTADQSEDLIALTIEAPEMFLDEIQEWLLIAHHVGLSKSSIHETLRDCGITYKLLRRAAAECDLEAKMRWREENQPHLHARQCVWGDESSKDDRTIYRHYGRAVSGRRAVVQTNFNRGERFSLVAAMSVDGYVASRVVPDSVDGAEFLDFIVADVLPCMNPFPGDRSVLILDNCAIHKSETLREIIEGYGCKLLFLPAYCPDLNPIENSFSAVKAWLRRHYRTAETAEDPMQFLTEATSAINSYNATGWAKLCGYIVD